LLVSDKDLQGAGTVQVTVTSTSQPAGAAVTLQETKAGSGVFQGEAALGSGQGQIAVAHGDTLTAIYRDANDGTGRQVERQATAPVDCQGPSVRNVEVVDVTDTAATIRFETDEDSRATIRHGDACDALSDTTDARVFARTHEVQLAGLRPGTRHVFGIDAADRVDNITVDRRAGQCWFFTTGVRSCALNDDLEPGPEPGWTHAALAGVDDWGVQLVPGTHSESHAFLTTSTDGIKDAVLVFPPLDIAPGDHLAFWHGVFLEDGYDGGVLEVSTDGGQTWEDAGSGLEQGGYVGPIEDGPLGGRNAWTGVIGLAGPVEVVADLTAWAGAARQLRFRISCDESFGDGAWIIDDVSVCHFINKRGQLSASRDVAHCASAVTLQLEDLDLQGAGARRSTRRRARARRTAIDPR
jgi:hypothetical protein